MKFNISYFGYEQIFHLRRDFILMLKYSLESLGHHVILSGAKVKENHINILIGGYFLPSNAVKFLLDNKFQYINVGTEMLTGRMLNHSSDKTDFEGAYLPLMRGAFGLWDGGMENMEGYASLGLEAHFMRLAYVPELDEIQHKQDKDLDFYLFGMGSERRNRVINEIHKAGFVGEYDHSCPYFLRNDRIARAKVQLNIKQDDKFSHVNTMRVCYLANNRCYTLSEVENDPVGYLSYADSTETLVDDIGEAVEYGNWKHKAEHYAEEYRKITMKSVMEELLEKTFA